MSTMLIREGEGEESMAFVVRGSTATWVASWEEAGLVASSADVDAAVEADPMDTAWQAPAN